MWELNFISESDFENTVGDVIQTYRNNARDINLKTLNANKIDPIKMVMDTAIYGRGWNREIEFEISRQRDKSNNNVIGLFHQKIFSHIKNCIVDSKGWDITYIPEKPYFINNNPITKICVELKNKHNTMNHASSERTFEKMWETANKNTACFLVEVISRTSHNRTWKTTIDNVEYYNPHIRKVSIDNFYHIVTGQEDAFKQLCYALPKTINKIKDNFPSQSLYQDTVLGELREESNKFENDDEATIHALYNIVFKNYLGFEKC